MRRASAPPPVADLLVVDDTPANLRLLTELLREYGYTVRGALSGALALGAVAQQPPDLILLDIKMPGMDGFEVCAELKRRPEAREIPIIFISALDDLLDKVHAFEAGGADYITKPFEAPEVLARVRTHLSVVQANRELERRVQERTAELERSNRTLRTRSEVNQTLIHAEQEQELLTQVCRILIEVGGYRMAWAGYPRAGPEGRVEPVAWAGLEGGDTLGDTLGDTSADDARGHDPTSTVLRTRRPCIVHDIERESSGAPWRHEALARGYRSAVGLPLQGKDELLGVLTVYNDTPDAFGQEEVALLVELSDDLAFGILTLRVRASLREHQEQLEELVESRTVELSAANERLQELDRLKSMFIATMSHELRTPLNAIIGFTGMLLQGMSGELTPQQSSDLGRVSRAARHLLALISDIIDISKIEAGHVTASPEDFRLQDVAQEAIDIIKPDMDAKGLTLGLEVLAWPEMHADRKRVFQCLLNLLSNAVKYSEGGTITLFVQESNDHVHIAVTDMGIGIAPEDMSRLFTAFERLDSDLRVQAGGTGLGLYLTKKIATELLGGTVEVKSRLGEGSTFSLHLPRVATVRAHTAGMEVDAS